MNFKEFLILNNYQIRQNTAPYIYLGTQLEKVTISDMQRYKAIEKFLNLPENINLDAKTFLGMLKKESDFMHSITKYPRSFNNFFTQIKEHGSLYIAFSISEEVHISRVSKQANQALKKSTIKTK